MDTYSHRPATGKATISFAELDRLRANRHGTDGKVYTVCPFCSPGRSTPLKRKRRVLCTWMKQDNFISYSCAHCGERGYARREGATSTKPTGRHDPAEYETRHRQKARWLWRVSKSARGTPVEHYLRSRGITVPLPSTVRFLPAHKPEHHPAMIVPFGIPGEPEPGVLNISETSITAVHLTLLKPDGSGKADVDPNKITLASPSGMPMVLAPMNDLMGLAITEGIEDALSVHRATGLGAWASGGAKFLPKLVTAIEDLATTREYDASPDCITILVDDDADGRLNAHALASSLIKLSAKLAAPPKTEHFEVRLMESPSWK
jgi:hypothetical protein